MIKYYTNNHEGAKRAACDYLNSGKEFVYPEYADILRQFTFGSVQDIPDHRIKAFIKRLGMEVL